MIWFVIHWQQCIAVMCGSIAGHALKWQKPPTHVAQLKDNNSNAHNPGSTNMTCYEDCLRTRFVEQQRLFLWQVHCSKLLLHWPWPCPCSVFCVPCSVVAHCQVSNVIVGLLRVRDPRHSWDLLWPSERVSEGNMLIESKFAASSWCGTCADSLKLPSAC